MGNISQNEIILFTNSSKSFRKNTLKSFHAFLGHIKETRPFRYAYSSERPYSIPGATVLESICIERAACIPIQGKEVYSSDILRKITNPYINDLIAILGDINKVPDFTINPEHSKLAELVRVITTTNPYILLESPETYLSNEALKIVRFALQHEVRQAVGSKQKKQILLFTENTDDWIEVSSKIVARDQSGAFHINELSHASNSIGTTSLPQEFLKKAA